MIDKNKVEQAISKFTSDPHNGEAWSNILYNAPAYAMERIAISMYHSVFGKSMTQEDQDEYRALREEIDATLGREDLEYLVKVMPKSKKDYYRALLSLTPQKITPGTSSASVA